VTCFPYWPVSPTVTLLREQGSLTRNMSQGQHFKRTFKDCPTPES
jgi:hypothetical protein